MSVIICAYTTDRWGQLQEAVASVQSQEQAVEELIVVIDHNPELLARAQQRWAAGDGRTPRVQVVANTRARGLSGARNTGVAAAQHHIVAFLDDDARAETSWCKHLLAPYSDPDVMACGGRAEAALEGPRPRWWPLEFDWVVGCSYVGLPIGQAAVRNLIGANMSARRAAVVAIGGFCEDIGRVGSRPLGCEETDLFIRMAQRWPDARVVFEPLAQVHHHVPRARLSWRYFRSRCFAEGLSKAQVARRVGRSRALASERSYALRVLPRGMVHGVRAARHGENGAGLRAMAIGAGLLLTTAGYAQGRVTGSLRAGFAPRVGFTP
jgi:glycosyltransferase involved in cell wall biosynthesis